MFKSGPQVAPLGRSAFWGEADEIGAEADIADRMSAAGGKADVPGAWPELQLLATSGHWDGLDLRR